jgi:four helix bundle protein
MLKVNRFEDLEAWQTARDVVQMVYQQTKAGQFSDRYLQDEMRRAGIAMMTNIAVGFSKPSTKEYCQFLFAAKSAAAELQSHAYVALDQAYLKKSDFQQLHDGIDNTARLIVKLIKYLTAQSWPPTTPSSRRTQ